MDKAFQAILVTASTMANEDGSVTAEDELVDCVAKFSRDGEEA